MNVLGKRVPTARDELVQRSRAAVRRLRPLRRDQYKSTWSALGGTHRSAVEHVIGNVGEEEIARSARETREGLEATVALLPTDSVLEIGCGIGRVGAELAPRVGEWIGCDVSPTMLQHAGMRLAALPNVRLLEISGFDLAPVATASIDVVYCTVVFMHLDEWDRYGYVCEAFRVLKPGGRVYVDNFNLLSDEGWAVFEAHAAIPPARRPTHISKASTPQELERYLTKAGFCAVGVEETGLFVRAYGTR
jgi:SAM-dependent methyltransferase